MHICETKLSKTVPRQNIKMSVSEEEFSEEEISEGEISEEEEEISSEEEPEDKSSDRSTRLESSKINLAPNAMTQMADLLRNPLSIFPAAQPSRPPQPVH